MVPPPGMTLEQATLQSSVTVAKRDPHRVQGRRDLSQLGPGRRLPHSDGTGKELLVAISLTLQVKAG